MKQTTAAVIIPSIKPIARWIGCIKAINAPNGSSVIPERLVSITTEKAPSWSVIMHPTIDEIKIVRIVEALVSILENK